MNKRKLVFFITILSTSLLGIAIYSSVSALSGTEFRMYSENGILFYNPDEVPCYGGAINLEICGANLPEETIKMLESAGIKEKAEANMERYAYAEAETGLPWQIIAALHWREAGMDSGRSASNGDKLYDHINVDGVHVTADPNADAKQAAEHFIGMAKSVYGVDVIVNPTAENYALGFLAYNRGFMYKCRDVPYTESPYVMNYYDEDHMGMRWVHADSYDCKGNKLNSVEGKQNKQLGALTIIAYLCSDSAGSTESTDPTKSTDPAGSSDEEGSAGIFSEQTACGEFIYYDQCDPRWKDKPFSEYTTICPSGCGPSSFAMMATALLGREITPEETAKIAGDAGMYIPNVGSSHAITETLANHYGLEYKNLSGKTHDDAIKVINEYLKDGWMIQTSGGGTTPFTGSGHLIGIRGIADDGESWLIADSNGNGGGEANTLEKTYKPDDLISAGMNLNNIRAIRSASGSTSSCISRCSTSADGFGSKEEAEVIIDSYKASDLSSYGLIRPKTGDLHHNCVAFSTWFINYYTDLSYTNPPDGSKLVNSLKGKYSDLVVSDKPTVYSVASWSTPGGFVEGGNHTGIIVGINEAEDKIIIAEAGWEHPEFTGVHEYKLSSVTDGQYINLNSRLKSNTELR